MFTGREMETTSGYCTFYSCLVLANFLLCQDILGSLWIVKMVVCDYDQHATSENDEEHVYFKLSVLFL